jgi:hypothetical protein
MIFRGSQISDTWVFGRGKQNYLKNNDALMANIKTRLRMIYSECVFDPTMGVQWFALLGQKDSTKLVLAVKREIYNCYGVVKVLDVSFDLEHITRKLTVSYLVDTIFSSGISGSFVV